MNNFLNLWFWNTDLKNLKYQKNINKLKIIVVYHSSAAKKIATDDLFCVLIFGTQI